MRRAAHGAEGVEKACTNFDPQLGPGKQPVSLCNPLSDLLRTPRIPPTHFPEEPY